MSPAWTAIVLTIGLAAFAIAALAVLLRPPPSRPRPLLETWAILAAVGLFCWLLPAVVTAWQAAT